MPSTTLRAIAKWSVEAPGQTAIEFGQMRLSYQELWELSGQVAAALRKHRTGRGDLVAIATGRGPDFVVACVAAWRAGAAYLPLELATPRSRLLAVVNDAKPALLLAGTETAGLGDALGLPEILVQRTGGLAAEPYLPAVSDDADRAYVIYTSGTTGIPKGVEVSHRSLDNLVSWHVSQYGVVPQDRALHTAGLGFDAAVWEIWPYLRAGATVVVCPDDDRVTADGVSFQLEEDRCTLAFASTPLAEELLAVGGIPASLRYLLTGGDILRLPAGPPEGCQLVNHYGPTEATVVTTSYLVSEKGSGAMPPIGKPITGAEVLLCDDNLAEVPRGDVGEILIGGIVLAAGYLGRPSLTAERFVNLPGRDGRWYRSGDLAHWAAGELIFSGRRDLEQLKVRGARVEATDIEAALLATPHVLGAVVTTVGHGADTRLVALVNTRITIAVKELRQSLADRLPRNLVPTHFIFGTALPLTANGKVDRAMAAAQAQMALEQRTGE